LYVQEAKSSFPSSLEAVSAVPCLSVAGHLTFGEMLPVDAAVLPELAELDPVSDTASCGSPAGQSLDPLPKLPFAKKYEHSPASLYVQVANSSVASAVALVSGEPVLSVGAQLMARLDLAGTGEETTAVMTVATRSARKWKLNSISR